MTQPTELKTPEQILQSYLAENIGIHDAPRLADNLLDEGFAQASIEMYDGFPIVLLNDQPYKVTISVERILV